MISDDKKPIFTADMLGEALTELGQLAHQAGQVIDIAVYGGSCLMLVSNFRVSTADVDAVAAVDQGFLDIAAQTVAARRGWPRDWLNDGVRTYLSPQVEGFAQHTLFRTYPNEQAPGLRADGGVHAGDETHGAAPRSRQRAQRPRGHSESDAGHQYEGESRHCAVCGAHELKGVAALDEAEALLDQALELDRLDLGAVLLGLAAALRLLVEIELALDAVGLAVEQVDERPQEISDILLEAGARQHGAEGHCQLNLW
jgi:hypothetical protein